MLSWLDLPNVEYLGLLPYKELPQFLGALDVCLIPHRNTEYCKSMSPLKLFQYLASGRPIVATEIEGLDRVKDLVRVARSHQEFVQLIERSLEEDSEQDSARRIARARLESWESRVQEMFQAVMSNMAAQSTNSKPRCE